MICGLRRPDVKTKARKCLQFLRTHCACASIRGQCTRGYERIGESVPSMCHRSTLLARLSPLHSFLSTICRPTQWRIGHCTVVTLLLMTFVVLYRVQYQLGIDLVPFFPIDKSGFDRFSPALYPSVQQSYTAIRQPRNGAILCWVMTTGVYHRTRIRAINDTWLSLCDSSHVFTDTQKGLDHSVPWHTLFHGLPTHYFQLFWKTRLALHYTYTQISDQFQWYVKADDDTYLVMDSLRRYLATLDPEQPHFLGFRIRRRMTYNAGGSGYVLSRPAMHTFAHRLFPDRHACDHHEWEDLAIARCLAAADILPEDTRDELGRQRFLPWRPEEHYHADLTKSFLFDPIEHVGPSVFHENLVSMHHLSPDEIRLIHGMLYGVRNATAD